MKKKTLISCYTIISLFTWVVSPAATVFAADDENGTSTEVTASAQTTLTANVGSENNEEPIIKAKWEMDGPAVSMTGTDDDEDAGAQFDPSGQYQVDKDITLCAIATDPDGIADIDSVYGDLYYPNIKIHEGPQEPGREGCGKMVGTECRMKKLTKDNGLALFCDKIRNDNTNLPVFGVGYDYNDICKADGELQKETAAVYCCDKVLSYEDPAGDYKVIDFAQDKSGLSSEPLQNMFTYEPVTSFETDFDLVKYGNVKLNTHKIISGDLNWALVKNADGATVRNVGNTRAQISVLEDDMGLGKTGSCWNIKYDGRIGNSLADWQNYDPNEVKWLKKTLDLSELNEVDFSVLIKKFPLGTGPDYNGNILLGSQEADPLECGEPTTGTLTVNKVLDPEEDPGLFNLTVNGQVKAPNVGDGGTTGEMVMPTGTYTVGETAGTGTSLGNYTSVISGDCAANGSVTIAAGDDKTCTITNTLIPPQPANLIVNKVVVNSPWNGNNVVADFQLTVNGTPVVSGATNAFTPGSHHIGESGVSGYAASFTGDCDASGNVTLVSGQTKTCTLTNTALPAIITLVKVVDAGTASPNDFNMTVDGVNVPNGTSKQVTANAPHAVNETLLNGYSFVSITGDAACPSVLGGTATLSEGQSITCTIHNSNAQ